MSLMGEILNRMVLRTRGLQNPYYGIKVGQNLRIVEIKNGRCLLIVYPARIISDARTDGVLFTCFPDGYAVLNRENYVATHTSTRRVIRNITNAYYVPVESTMPSNAIYKLKVLSEDVGKAIAICGGENKFSTWLQNLDVSVP